VDYVTDLEYRKKTSDLGFMDKKKGDNPDGEGQSRPLQEGDSPAVALILDQIKKVESSLNSSISSVSTRVDQLSTAVFGPSRKRPAESGLWADRDRDDDLYASSLPTWQNSDGEDEGENVSPDMLELLEHNLAIVRSSFSSTLSNAERRRIRNQFPVPNTEQTRCPRLDPPFKANAVKGEVKTATQS
jgi:hypothetical protein